MATATEHGLLVSRLVSTNLTAIDARRSGQLGLRHAQFGASGANDLCHLHARMFPQVSDVLDKVILGAHYGTETSA